jgi:hypothetical protein
MNKLKISDKVWMMVDNKAVELTVTQITVIQKIIKGENEIKDSTQTTYDIWGSWSILYTRDVQIKDGLFFNTKQDLINSL